MLRFVIFFSLIFPLSGFASTKKVALTFDDSPRDDTLFYSSEARIDDLINKLKKLKISSVMIFANPCRNNEATENIEILKKYKKAGHLIENHTCNHPRLDKVGFDAFIKDIEKADHLLKPLMMKQKYFRFPFLNEGSKKSVRNKVRQWLNKNGYINARITGDNEDPTFSSKLKKAKELGKKIDYEAVKALFVEHIVSSLECNDKLAVKNLGRSPSHVLLLHEADATVMFLEDLVTELKNKGWKIIEPLDAYKEALRSQVHSDY